MSNFKPFGFDNERIIRQTDKFLGGKSVKEPIHSFLNLEFSKRHYSEIIW